jgi:hypothetical protein
VTKCASEITEERTPVTESSKGSDFVDLQVGGDQQLSGVSELTLPKNHCQLLAERFLHQSADMVSIRIQKLG